jgi:type I restriction enzyme S subunit
MNNPTEVTLGQLIEFQRGYDLPKSEFVFGDVPVISSNGILGYHNQVKVKAPGITIGRSGTVGLPHFIEKDFFPHNTALFIKDFKGNYPRYIYYLLKTLGLHDRKSGSGVPTMNRNHLHPLKIKAHLDFDEQKQIAEILSSLDTKIGLNNRINAELEAMAKTLYDYWFVQFDFPDKNGKPYKASGGKMVWNEEMKREIPEGWEVKDLEQVEKNIITGKTPSTLDRSNFDGEIPFICIGDVRGNMHIVKTELTLSKKGAETQKNKFIPEGAICVTCIATPGLVGFATTNSQTNQQLNTIVCEKFENRYFLYFYLSNYFRFSKAKTGNTFANMNKGDFSSIKVLVPAKNTLISFAQHLEPSINKILNNSKENLLLSDLRDWLLPMLMNGQVSVGEVEELGMVVDDIKSYGK